MKKFFSILECNQTNDIGRLDGEIRSENYPLLYPSNCNCIYKIQTPTDTKIKLIFVEVEIDDEQCENDYLEIMNENQNASQRICQVGLTFNYRCSTCRKGFNTLDSLQNHLNQNPSKTCNKILK